MVVYLAGRIKVMPPRKWLLLMLAVEVRAGWRRDGPRHAAVIV